MEEGAGVFPLSEGAGEDAATLATAACLRFRWLWMLGGTERRAGDWSLELVVVSIGSKVYDRCPLDVRERERLMTRPEHEKLRSSISSSTTTEGPAG